jgi:hypothetical protein
VSEAPDKAGRGFASGGGPASPRVVPSAAGPDNLPSSHTTTAIAMKTATTTASLSTR